MCSEICVLSCQEVCPWKPKLCSFVRREQGRLTPLGCHLIGLIVSLHSLSPSRLHLPFLSACLSFYLTQHSCTSLTSSQTETYRRLLYQVQSFCLSRSSLPLHLRRSRKIDWWSQPLFSPPFSNFFTLSNLSLLVLWAVQKHTFQFVRHLSEAEASHHSANTLSL